MKRGNPKDNNNQCRNKIGMLLLFFSFSRIEAVYLAS
jgi:hypothetical protein